MPDMSKHIDPEMSKTKHHLVRTNAAVEVLVGENVLVPIKGAKISGTDAVPVTLAAVVGVPPAENVQGPLAEYATLPRVTLLEVIVRGLPQTELAAA